MASAINWRTRPALQQHRREQAAIPLKSHLVGVLAFTLPYLLLGIFTRGTLFLSDARAALLGSTLSAISNGRMENIVLSYPIVPSLIAALRPMPTTMMIAAAFTAGATLWVLWQTLARTKLHLVPRAALLLAFAAAPTTTYLATQSFGEMFALLLFLIAWNNFVIFAQTNATWNGFATGLVIGLSFFVSLYALVYGLIFVISAPFYLYERGTPLREQRARIVTGTIVIAFPTLSAFFAWSYLNWIFTGDPFTYVREIISPLSAFAENPDAPLLGTRAILEATLYDVLRLPIYLLVGLLTLVFAPRRLITFLVPVVVITATRTALWTYSEPFALATLMVVALAGVSTRLSRSRLRTPLSLLIIPVALLQLALAYTLPNRSVPQNDWRAVMTTNRVNPKNLAEQQTADWLATLPAHSVLIDSAANYALITRMGTADPLLDADNPRYTLAVSAPAQYVDYLLISTGDALWQRFHAGLPDGFVPEATWGTVQLYRREAAADTP